MGRLTELFTRGILLRCPVCGRGPLFRSLFSMNKECPNCHYHYEREIGYFSSAMAIDLIISELIVTAIIVPLAANRDIPILPILLWTLPLAFILPVAFWWHSRALWMSMDHYLHPITGRYVPRLSEDTEAPPEKH
jgi:uncharacterized protein (DUF983 family)